MFDYIIKTLNLITILPKKFFLHFFLFFIVAIGVIIFEIIGIAFLMPLLTMMEQANYDASKFSSFVIKLNNIFFDYFSVELTATLTSLSVTIFSIYLIKIAIQLFSTWISAKIAMNAQHFYSLSIYKSYLTKNFNFHLIHGPAKLFRNVIFEANTFASSILFPLLTLLVEILILISIFIFSFLIEPRIMFVIVTMFVIVILLFIATKKIISEQGKIRIKYDEKRISDVQNSFDSIKDVIIYNVSNLFLNSFKEKNSIINISNFYIRIFSSIPRLILELVAVTILIIAIFIFSKTNNGIEIIGLFLIIAFRSMPSIAKLTGTFQTFVFLRPTVNILNDEFKKITIKKKLNNAKKYNKVFFKKDIKFSNVNFYYDNKNKLISNLYLRIKKGSKLGVIGESGFGKSTMINLLMGLVEPKRGFIKVDNQILNKTNIENWRTKIGYVGQKIALINGGIIENVVLDRTFDKKKFSDIVKACSLEIFINKYPILTPL